MPLDQLGAYTRFDYSSHEQAVVRQVTARVDERRLAGIHDQKLVRLHALALVGPSGGLVAGYQIFKDDALVVAVVVQRDGHGLLSAIWSVRQDARNDGRCLRRTPTD